MVSISLVLVLLIGSTYSIFMNSNVDENLNVYRTGNLDVTYTLSENNVKKSAQKINEVYQKLFL